MRARWREYGMFAALTLGLVMAGAAAPTRGGQGAAPATPGAPTGPKPMSPPAVTAASEDIRDIRAPKSMPRIWPWIALGGGVTAAGVAAWLAWRRRKPARAPSPRDIALDRLEAALRWMTPGHVRDFCYEVSEIVRGYIEQRFQILAPRETTEEFLRELLGSTESTLVAHREALSDFLGHCDLAKYAGWQFAVPEMESMHASARAFVTLTSDEGGAKAQYEGRNKGEHRPAAVGEAA